MQGQAVSGQTLRFPHHNQARIVSRTNDVWQRWRSLHSDILRHVRVSDRLGVDLTIDRLAEELDESLGLVERRVEELCSLQLISCHNDRRIELENGTQLLCG